MVYLCKCINSSAEGPIFVNPFAEPAADGPGLGEGVDENRTAGAGQGEGLAAPGGREKLPREGASSMSKSMPSTAARSGGNIRRRPWATIADVTTPIISGAPLQTRVILVTAAGRRTRGAPAYLTGASVPRSWFENLTTFGSVPAPCPLSPRLVLDCGRYGHRNSTRG